jgi:hypothetical protein
VAATRHRIQRLRRLGSREHAPYDVIQVQPRPRQPQCQQRGGPLAGRAHERGPRRERRLGHDGARGVIGDAQLRHRVPRDRQRQLALSREQERGAFHVQRHAQRPATVGFGKQRTDRER